MQQTLIFEGKWDKTLSEKDRNYIKRVFNDTSHSARKIEFVPLWTARNHKNELLVTVLIHNRTIEEITFSEDRLSFIANEEIIATHVFTYPSLCIEQQTSMPWTFIFPEESIMNDRNIETGSLCLM